MGMIHKKEIDTAITMVNFKIQFVPWVKDEFTPSGGYWWCFILFRLDKSCFHVHAQPESIPFLIPLI